MKDIIKLSDEEILEEARRLRIGYGLKHTIRYASKRDSGVHAESVAEHIFGLIYLAHYFLEHEPTCKNINRQKVYDILLFHDFGEIKHGDAVTYYKTKEHEEKEKEAAKEIFSSLPESFQKFGYELWKEYEEHTTLEAKFAYALDKVEPLFELLHEVNEQSMKRLKVTPEMNINNKVRAAKEYPLMMRFVEVISNDMVRRNVFWSE